MRSRLLANAATPPCRRPRPAGASAPVPEPAGHPAGRRAGGGHRSLDHEATWLIGHTQHISFSSSGRTKGELYVDADAPRSLPLLQSEGSRAQCAAARLRRAQPTRARASRASPGSWAATGSWSWRTAGSRAAWLPRPGGFRCSPAATLRAGPCRTADNTAGAACCRDLQIEIMCTKAAAQTGGTGAVAPVAVSLQGGTGRATSRSRRR